MGRSVCNPSSLPLRYNTVIRISLENRNNLSLQSSCPDTDWQGLIPMQPRARPGINRSIWGATASLMASLGMDVGDDYLHLPRDNDHDDYTSESLSSFEALLFLSSRPPGAAAYAAGIIPRVGIAGAPRDSELAAAVVQELTRVDASPDGTGCPICMDDDHVVWKETPYGHRFHGRCVETWLKAKGSCPMCRRQVVTMPTTRSGSWRILRSGRRLPSS